MQVGAYWKDSTWLEEFLQKQRPFMQGVNPPALGSSVAAIAMSLSLLFSFIPAWRAARFDPVEALRYE